MAFAHSVALSKSWTSWRSSNSGVSYGTKAPVFHRCTVSRRTIMMAERPETVPQPETVSQSEVVSKPEVESVPEDQTAETAQYVNAQSILKEMRAEAAKDSGPRSSNMGITRDSDGRSNIWPLEPPSEVDKKPQMSRAAIFGIVIAVVVIALILFPRLPLTNLDQL